MKRLTLICCILALCSLGCSRSSTGYERYIPAVPDARAALDLVLKRWQAGDLSEAITTVSPSIQIGDTHRNKNRPLVGYEILGDVPGDGPRCFAVRLSLANPSEQQQTRYLVIGNDPLWVFRQEDYDMLLHWCDTRPPQEVTSPAR